jgi:hypothetical protein
MNSTLYRFGYVLALFLAVVVFTPMPTVIAGESATEPASQTEELVKKVLARSNALFSGRFSYHFTNGFADKHSIISDYDMKFSFMSSSWILRFSNGAVHVSHAGKFVEYYSGQQDGATKYVAHVGLAKELDSDHALYAPNLLGTIWYDCTKKYISSHAGAARRPKDVVIDGVQTELLEWDVPASDVYSAFSSINELARSGGKLRLYAAPQLGFALPLIEYIGSDGRVMTQFKSANFKEVAPGVFYPTDCTSQVFTASGPSYYNKYHVLAVDSVNEQIPDKEFTLELTEGTQVSDSRNGKQAIFFQVGKNEPIPIPDLQNVLIPSEAPTAGFSRWLLGIGIGTVVGALAVAVYLICKRRARTV